MKNGRGFKKTKIVNELKLGLIEDRLVHGELSTAGVNSESNICSK